MIGAKALTECRICGGDVMEVLDLGDHPLANAFRSSPDEPEQRFPLRLNLCSRCVHLQLDLLVDREALFRNYIYSARPNPQLSDHFRKYADEVMERCPIRNPNHAPLVVEIGSNDGLMLEYFRERGYRTIGVDPAANIPAPEPIEASMRREFFSSELAGEIRECAGPACAVIANNVLAHIEDLHDAVKGMRRLVASDGLIAVELPYMRQLTNGGIYDSIYHEHLSLFGRTALCTLFEQHGLHLNESRAMPVQGGSLRCVFRTERSSMHAMGKSSDGKWSDTDWTTVRQMVERHGSRIRRDLDKIQGRIIGYGASARGNTVLNYTGVGPYLECLIDDMPSKQGLYAPGSGLEVKRREDVEDPAAFLLLAWNYVLAIRAKEREYRGEFIYPYAL